MSEAFESTETHRAKGRRNRGVRRFSRRGRAGSDRPVRASAVHAVTGEANVGGTAAPHGYTAMCWLLQPASTRPVAPVEVVVSATHVEVRLTSRDAGVHDAPLPPTWQNLDRLVQIDAWGSDLDLLFLESGSSLSLTSLRVAGDGDVEPFLSSVTTAYEACVGSPFPQNSLLVHASRDRTGD
jgi:hypothetical protein